MIFEAITSHCHQPKGQTLESGNQSQVVSDYSQKLCQGTKEPLTTTLGEKYNEIGPHVWKLDESISGEAKHGTRVLQALICDAPWLISQLE